MPSLICSNSITAAACPEDGGYPDQTYDTWLVRGESAYSGGLWLGALRASEEMAELRAKSPAAPQYHEMFLKAQKSYIGKLWNGEYFLYDTESEYREDIQADQLAGQWYADIIGLGDLVPKEMRQSALNKILFIQRDEIRQRRNGRREWHRARWLARSQQRTSPGSLDGNNFWLRSD